MIHELASDINQAQKIIVLTGAGISTASGIPDFRSQHGIWNNSSLEDIINFYFFQENPVLFWKTYKKVFHSKFNLDIQPNEAHFFLKELEMRGKEVTILTQNVDGLHQKAGSKNVLEMHGSISKAICLNCKSEYQLEYINKEEVPKCYSCNTILKPDIVLFGEQVRYYQKGFNKALLSDLFLVIGTSLKVSPVNLIPLEVYNDLYKDKDIKMAIINKEKTDFDYLFNISIKKDIVKTLREVKSFVR